MSTSATVVGLVPARSGSKRVPDKNIKNLGGHPLLAYSVASALASEVFDAVVVSTDTPEYAEIAEYYGAEVPTLRPRALAGSASPDIEWVEHMLEALRLAGRTFECFSILRPTSPFRLPETIRRAWKLFSTDPTADSLRAVEKCRQHPGKMWTLNKGAGSHQRMFPLMPLEVRGQPWHSNQYHALPEIYVQNASLEIARTRVATEDRSISGHAIVPFLSEGYEAFDINDPLDWQLAELLLRSGDVELPKIARRSFPG